MKRIILSIGLLFIILDSFTQGIFHESKKCLNISTELANYGIYLFPNFAFDYKRHSLAIGPLINIYPSYNFVRKVNNVYYPTKHRFYGFHLFYQFNFLPDKLFDPFIQTNLTYENLKLFDYREPSINQKISYESHYENLSQTVGIGIKVNFSHRIYSCLSIDYGFNYFKNFKETKESTSQINVPSDQTGFLRLGFGYRF